MWKQTLFKESLFLLIIIGFLHLIAIKFYLYWNVFEFDSMMHFLGGLWSAIVVLWFYFYSGFFEPTKRKSINFLIVSLFGLVAIAVFWEVFELFAGLTFVYWQDYAFDTTLDFIMDTLGALVGCLYAYLKEIYKRELVLTNESALKIDEDKVSLEKEFLIDSSLENLQNNE